MLTVLRAVRREWPVEDQWSRAQVEDWVSRALARDDAEHAAMAKEETGDVDGDLGGSESWVLKGLKGLVLQEVACVVVCRAL